MRTLKDGVTDGAHNFTFNKVGEYIWILYRIENMPEICPDGKYTASFTVNDV